MPALLDALTRQALDLPAGQRAFLANRLLQSLEPQADPQADALWEEEICCRIAELDSGQLATVPASEVFAELERLLPEVSATADSTGGSEKSGKSTLPPSERR